MQQKPVIYVSRITNLSDARYCAGMGADMLGFVVDPDDPDYVSPQQYQQMVGWIAGPKRVIEVPGILPPDWKTLLEAYKPDLLHISRKLDDRSIPDLPLICTCTYSDWLTTGELRVSGRAVDYLVLNELPATLNKISRHGNATLLLSIENVGMWSAQEGTGATGIALQGTRESAPGLKDYDHLSSILEAIEN